MSEQSTSGNDHSFKEIKNCDETVEVNKKALERAVYDDVFDGFGNVHQRVAKRILREKAQPPHADKD